MGWVAWGGMGWGGVGWDGDGVGLGWGWGGVGLGRGGVGLGWGWWWQSFCPLENLVDRKGSHPGGGRDCHHHPHPTSTPPHPISTTDYYVTHHVTH